ncbi:unnamed protein product [Bursaphelenchus xylophilus]|uniref:(pine wood nematode) hypothetical protein n=1 Tax=Bursaphelenchus xylophilus TaxID=6326 RepID=A0A1I7RL31_BURXY|nr:unnamed protein product [Bursaphelenchus xylophilus]CAG9083528.1 unnamed protein product [Bursaphelenchus xylophilus]
MLLHLLVGILLQTQLSTSQLLSPCSYPHYENRGECALQETSILKGWACDPENTISMAELHILNNYITDIYRIHGNTCHCPKAEKSDHCGYKFGFAFIKNISQAVYPSMDHLTKGFCPQDLPLSPRKGEFTIPEEVLNYVQNYARIVRERWNLGTCGEDILILIVNEPPEQLIPHAFNQRRSQPFLVVSFGKLITTRYGTSLDQSEITLDALSRIVNEENMNLQNGYPLIKVLNDYVSRTIETLNLAGYKLRVPHSKHHIPLWAWVIFASCGVLFIMMAAGLCLVKSTSRRGTLRGKSNALDPARRWKAGFVGEENQPITYVNLVQMMMPHPRNPPPNLQQQVTI